MNESESKTNSTEYRLPEQDQPSPGELFSQDLNRINDVIVEMLVSPGADTDALREAWTVRAILTENFIDSLDGVAQSPSSRLRVQFDLIVDKALIYEKSNNLVRYLGELDTAEGFALNSGLEDEAMQVGVEIDSKIAELDDSQEALIVKLRPYVSFENREYLRELLSDGSDAEDFLDAVYGTILEDGGDPDEVLATLGVTE